MATAVTTDTLRRRLPELAKITAQTGVMQGRNHEKMGIRPRYSKFAPVPIEKSAPSDAAVNWGMLGAMDQWPLCNAWELAGCDGNDWSQATPLAMWETIPEAMEPQGEAEGTQPT